MYIPIQKIEETADAALYAFRVEDLGWIRFRVDRSSGASRLEDSTPGIEGHYVRASKRVRDLWSLGHFPQRTCWAS